MRQQLGQLLLEEGKIRETDLQQALDNRGAELLGDVLVSQSACTEDDVLDALSKQLGIWRVRLSELDINPALISKVKAKVAAHYRIVPLYFRGNALVVASANPQDEKRFEELTVLLGCPVKPMLCGKDDVNVALKKYYGVGNSTEDVTEPPLPLAPTLRHPAERLTEVEDTVVDVVDRILAEANSRGATDIHIEPTETSFKIRTRVYGIMAPADVPAGVIRFGNGLISRLKIMANLGVAEKSRPQSGRAKVRVGDEDIDMRVSVLPTALGETVHIKLLRATVRYFDLTRLGMSDRDLLEVERAIGTPQGMVLVAGPVGSGKTTSLYAMLKRVRNDGVKIITAEDPVEYRLEGVTQIEVGPGSGVSTVGDIHHLLDHDADVMMLGSLTDTGAAVGLLQATLAGRKAFASMSADTAAQALVRLLQMDVRPYLIASGVRCVVAQRLVRTLCDTCKTKVRQERDLFAGQWPAGTKPPRKVYEIAGCADCEHTGFRGQTGIFEVMRVDDGVREAIRFGATVHEIEAAARGAGMRTLREDGLAKVAEGRTTIAEVMRVVGLD